MTTSATNITSKDLLIAARAGTITALIIDSDILPRLAGGDGPDTYPYCTIALRVRPVEIRTVTAWKHVYWAKGNDPMTGHQILPPGSGEMCVANSDGCTRGDFTLYVENDAPAPQQCEEEDKDDTETPAAICFDLGEGCSETAEIDVRGLTEDEAEEVRAAMEEALSEAYSEWEPEHPADEDIYDALVSQRSSDADVELTLTGQDDPTRIGIYSGTHCGMPQFAFEGDEDKTVYYDAWECANQAREKLAHILASSTRDAEVISLTAIVSQLEESINAD